MSLPIFVCHFEIGAEIVEHFEVTRSDKNLIVEPWTDIALRISDVLSLLIPLPAKLIWYTLQHTYEAIPILT